MRWLELGQYRGADEWIGDSVGECENIREGNLHLGFKVWSGVALMLEWLALVGS